MRDESGTPSRKALGQTGWGRRTYGPQKSGQFLVYCSRRSSTKTVTGPEAKYGYKGYPSDRLAQGMQRSLPEEKEQAHGSSQVSK